MESLRRLMSPKDDQPWETILEKWDEFLESPFFIDEVDYDLNPWEEWCTAWNIYERSHSKTPKSGKKKKDFWQELYHVAVVTANKINQQKDMRQDLAKKEDEIMKLKVAIQNLKKQNAEITNLQEENLKLRKKIEKLQNKLVLDEQYHQQQLETEVSSKLSAQIENTKLNSTLKEMLRNNMELENQAFELKEQIVQIKEEKEVSKNYNQYNKNITIVNYRPIQQYIEGIDSWHEMAKIPGVGCPSRDKIWRRLLRYECSSCNKNATYWQLVVRLSRYEDLVNRKSK